MNNPVVDNNTRRFLFVTYRRVPYTARASTNGSRRHIRSSDRSTAWPMTRDDTWACGDLRRAELAQ